MQPFSQSCCSLITPQRDTQKYVLKSSFMKNALSSRVMFTSHCIKETVGNINSFQSAILLHKASFREKYVRSLSSHQNSQFREVVVMKTSSLRLSWKWLLIVHVISYFHFVPNDLTEINVILRIIIIDVWNVGCYQNLAKWSYSSDERQRSPYIFSFWS